MAAIHVVGRTAAAGSVVTAGARFHPEKCGPAIADDFPLPAEDAVDGERQSDGEAADVPTGLVSPEV